MILRGLTFSLHNIVLDSILKEFNTRFSPGLYSRVQMQIFSLELLDPRSFGVTATAELNKKIGSTELLGV